MAHTPIEYNIVEARIGEYWDGLQINYSVDGDTDITNVDLKAVFKFNSESGTTVKTVSTTTPSGITKVDLLNGVAKIDGFLIDPAVFTKPGTYYYGVAFIKNSQPKVYLIGQWSLLPQLP